MKHEIKLNLKYYLNNKTDLSTNTKTQGSLFNFMNSFRHPAIIITSLTECANIDTVLYLYEYNYNTYLCII